MPAYTHVLMAATRLAAAIGDCVSRKCAGARWERTRDLN